MTKHISFCIINQKGNLKMGLYDSVYFEYSLPIEIKEFQNEEFQTSNFGDGLRSFILTKEGKLIIKSILSNIELEDKPIFDYTGEVYLIGLDNPIWPKKFCDLVIKLKTGILQEIVSFEINKH